MNIGIPHAQTMKIKSTINRNKLLAQENKYPRLFKERVHLKKNSMSWRKEYENLTEKIHSSEAHSHELLHATHFLRSKLDEQL